ncbi:MAG: LLM class flavin-dependent oxidoreductase, partial [Chloroflexi bacterium]|nr:LLM class flavin-dependent oxidoreductase [Chloroflexota bacterium]
RALAATGELADGWVTGALTPNLAEGFDAIRTAAAAAGRSTEKPYTVGLTGGCVLREGESLTSPRVIERVGPNALPGLHAMWESHYGPGANLGVQDPDAAAAFHRYIVEYGDARGSKPDRRYLDVHTGHMVYLKPGEEQFINEDSIGATLTGTPAQIIERLEEMEAAGIDNVAIACVDAAGARDLIADFGREVIARRSPS